MGFGSSLQGEQRKKRKREIQKNKEQRIKARDEKVVQTKTQHEVQQEINKIEKKKNLQHGETQKLQRLKKELKLLQEAAKLKKPEDERLAKLRKFQEQPKTELDDPRKSVYFHEVLNPFGAPPPGQPRLYHARGGRTTMDMKQAIVPGEEPPPPPPPRPSAPHHHQQHQRRQPNQNSSLNKQTDQSQKIQTENSPKKEGHKQEARSEPPSSSKEKHVDDGSPAAPAPMKQDTTPKTDKDKTIPKPDPSVIPALPPPSKSVKRRRGAAVDIWASTDELTYEEQNNNLQLDAVGAGQELKKKKKKKTKKPPLEFCYQDASGQVQGPFDKAQMRGWVQGGFFPPNTLVKSNRKDEWVALATVSALQESPQQQTAKGADEIESSPPSSVADRIAALKCQHDAEKEDQPIEPAESTVADRIAALKRQDQAHAEDNSATMEPPQPVDGSYPVDMSVPYPIDDGDVGPAPFPVDDHGDTSGPAAYPVDDIDQGDGYGEPAPYAIDDMDDAAAVAPYPVDDSDDIPNVPYPTDSHGDDDYPATDEYPAVALYNTDATEEYGYGVEEEPKKVVKVDKAVVSMRPTNLQTKRPKAVVETATSTLSKQAKENKVDAIDEAVESFFDELE